jgi:hypothetical protein
MLRVTARTRRRRGAVPAEDTKATNDWCWAIDNPDLTES